MAQVPITGDPPKISRRLDTTHFAAYSDFERWRAANADKIFSWEKEEDALIPAGQPSFSLTGHCVLCDCTEVDFMVDRDNSADELSLNWRESLLCPNCRMGNRVRAAMHIAIQDFGLRPGKQIYVTEQIGIVYRWLRGRYRDVLGSEYLSPEKASGARRLGINHQDIQDLSLEPNSVDWVITFDVMEHVPDPIAAFASFVRVLRPGGRLIMTAPFTINKYDTTVRAAMRPDGTIEHFLPIEIHGNPMDPHGGSLCFRHFGWDTLEQMTAEGFVEASVVVYHDRSLGYLGGLQTLFTAVKATKT